MTNLGNDVTFFIRGTHSVTISLGPLPYVYKLSQIKFHFGRKEGMGTEHTIDGKRFDAEVKKQNKPTLLNITLQWVTRHLVLITNWSYQRYLQSSFTEQTPIYTRRLDWMSYPICMMILCSTSLQQVAIHVVSMWTLLAPFCVRWSSFNTCWSLLRLRASLTKRLDHQRLVFVQLAICHTVYIPLGNVDPAWINHNAVVSNFIIVTKSVSGFCHITGIVYSASISCFS